MNKNTGYFFPVFLALVLAHTFFVSQKLYDPINDPKTFAFYFLAAGFIVIYCLRGIFTNGARCSVKLNLPDVLLLLYYVWIFIQVLLDKEIYFSNEQFITISLCLFIYFIVKSRLTSTMQNASTEWIVFFGILNLLIIVHCIIGLTQFTGISKNLLEDFKMGGTFGNPSIYSNFISALIPVELTVVFFIAKKNSRLIYWSNLIAFILSISIVVLSNERTAWIASFFSIGVVLWFNYSLGLKIKRLLNTGFKKAAVLAIFVVVLSFIFFGLYSYKKDSAHGRLFIWKLTTEIIKDHPFFGVGFEKYSTAQNEVKSNYFIQNANKSIPEERITADVPFAFNEYLQITAESGIIGIVLFGSTLLLLVFKRYPQSEEKEKRENKLPYVAALSGMVSILITALFSYPFRQPATLFLFFIYGSILSAYYGKPLLNRDFKKVSKAFYVALIIVFLWFIAHQKSILNAYVTWAKAAAISKEGQHREAKVLFAKVYPKLKNNNQFILNYGVELYFMGDYTNSIKQFEMILPVVNHSNIYINMGSSYEAINNYDKAEKCYLHALTLVPYKVYPRFKLVVMYKKTGQKEKAIQVGNELLRLIPKVNHANVENIKIEVTRILDEYNEE